MTPLAKRAHPHTFVKNTSGPGLLKPKKHKPFYVMRFILFNDHWLWGCHFNRQQQRWRPGLWAKRWCHEVQLILSYNYQQLNWRWHHPRVPLGPGATDLPMPAEVEVLLGLSAAAVPKAEAVVVSSYFTRQLPLPHLLQVPCSVPSFLYHSHDFHEGMWVCPFCQRGHRQWTSCDLLLHTHNITVSPAWL
jgi:hypothetical protein